MNEQDTGCLVCGRETDGDCDCPECLVCAQVGAPECYPDHVPYAGDSVQSFCDHWGIMPVSTALRAIDKNNTEHVWLVLHDGTRIYYHDEKRLAWLDKHPEVRLHKVGVGGIAWDGSDWEYSLEVEAGKGWTALEQAHRDFADALASHQAEAEDDEWELAQDRGDRHDAKR